MSCSASPGGLAVALLAKLSSPPPLRVVEAFLAGDDWTAILNDTGTYKAPWIP